MILCQVEQCTVKHSGSSYEADHQEATRHLLTHIAEALNGIWSLMMSAPAPVRVSKAKPDEMKEAVPGPDAVSQPVEAPEPPKPVAPVSMPPPATLITPAAPESPLISTKPLGIPKPTHRPFTGGTA